MNALHERAELRAHDASARDFERKALVFDPRAEGAARTAACSSLTPPGEPPPVALDHPPFPFGRRALLIGLLSYAYEAGRADALETGGGRRPMSPAPTAEELAIFYATLRDQAMSLGVLQHHHVSRADAFDDVARLFFSLLDGMRRPDDTRLAHASFPRRQSTRALLGGDPWPNPDFPNSSGSDEQSLMRVVAARAAGGSR